MLYPDGGVIADFLDRPFKPLGSEGEEIGRHDGVIQQWRQFSGQSFGDDLAEADFARFGVVPKKLQGRGVRRNGRVQMARQFSFMPPPTLFGVPPAPRPPAVPP